MYDSIHVYFQEALVLAEYTIRTFSLQMDGSKEERIVKQFHYTVWPDHGVPEYPTPLLLFVRKVASCNPVNAGPVVVHCRYIHLTIYFSMHTQICISCWLWVDL